MHEKCKNASLVTEASVCLSGRHQFTWEGKEFKLEVVGFQTYLKERKGNCYARCHSIISFINFLNPSSYILVHLFFLSLYLNHHSFYPPIHSSYLSPNHSVFQIHTSTNSFLPSIRHQFIHFISSSTIHSFFLSIPHPFIVSPTFFYFI